MVFNEWPRSSLDAISKVIDCKHRTPIYVDSGIPVVSPGTLKWGQLDLASPSKRVTEEDYQSLMDHCVVDIGDLVISRNQSIGVASYVDTTEPFILGQDTVLIKPNSEKVNKKFLYFKFQSERVQLDILRLAGGSTFSRINLSELRKLRFSIPPIQEQTKIAKILSAWDQAITTAEYLVENSRLQKKALTQQLLTGKKRLRGFQEDWRQIRLEKLFRRVTTKNTEANTNVMTISAQQGLIRQEDFFSKTVASEILDNYFLLKKGQFAYNKSYSNGYPMGAIKRLNKYDKGVVTTLYICFETVNENTCTPEFFEHYFESGLLNKGLSKIANEGGRAHGLLNVKPSDFFGLQVFVPEGIEQNAIAAVLTTADQEIQRLQAKLSCLKQEKKALMQQLLTGKRRVVADEQEVA
ncbi:restriction endonuclease subunit S [Pseudomonas sp. XS1P51]